MIFQRKNLNKYIIGGLITAIIALIILIVSSLNWHWTNSDVIYIAKHYKGEMEVRFFYQIFYGFLTISSAAFIIFQIIFIPLSIQSYKKTEFKLDNDKLFINYSEYECKQLNKKWSINLKPNNVINILEINEMEITNPLIAKKVTSFLFIKLNNGELYPLPNLVDSLNCKKIIESKIKELKISN
ncbi:Uncharacterised protein [Mycoplasmopsis maculosa]|uniref:Uncharacterized protein n=1 Tax=Mycoplasmopsis maculosa TaxID=114885 RepID=A0A449B476_9BACT|nr:hypothetical protein [Mycoplasmopsis maculosa]VEU75348.1 Uncharacterised protein [Mycoplasmopsis maculosa]